MNIKLVLLSITIVFAVFGQTNGNDSMFGEANGDDADLIFGNAEPHQKYVSVGERVKQESKLVQAEYQKRVHKRKLKYMRQCESSLNSPTIFARDNYSFCSLVHRVEGYLDEYMELNYNFQILIDVKAKFGS